MLATGEAIRSTGEAIAPRVNMLDEALVGRLGVAWGGCIGQRQSSHTDCGGGRLAGGCAWKNSTCPKVEAIRNGE